MKTTGSIVTIIGIMIFASAIIDRYVADLNWFMYGIMCMALGFILIYLKEGIQDGKYEINKRT